MKSLLAPNEPFIVTEETSLDADATAGSNVTLTLKNNDGIAEDTYLVIGHRGTEQCELQQVNAAVSGATDVQVANLNFNHSKDEPIAVFRYNQRKFYGSTSSTGTFTELTSDGSPKTIQVDDPDGTSLEYTGNEGFTYFKATYFNSETSEETDIDDAEAVLADESKRYTSIYNIRRASGLIENPYVSDLYIEIKRKQAENEINSSIYARYSLPLSEVPDLIENICTTLAAGYIHYEEYPEDDTGKKLLGVARGQLKSIQKGTQLLINSNGTELSRRSSSTGSLSGKPDGTETGDNKRSFTRDMIF